MADPFGISILGMEPLMVITDCLYFKKERKDYDDARLNQSSENNYNIQLSAILNYNRNFGENHILNATLGVERLKGRGDSYEAYR